MDLVSIIIPYFRKKKFIYKAVNSALKQSYKNIEIIVIYDDEDKSDLIYLKNIFKNKKKIRILDNKKNLGAGLSRNKGIISARGKYIAFLDSDDEWTKHKLNIQLSFMKNKNCLISHTSYVVKNDRKKTLGISVARNFFNYKELLKSCDIGLSTVVLNKKLFKKNCKFSNFKTKEDFILWLKILKKGYKIYGIDKKLSIWKKIDGSLSSSIPQKILDGFNVYYIFMKFNLLKSFVYLIFLSINSFRKYRK